MRSTSMRSVVVALSLVTSLFAAGCSVNTGAEEADSSEANLSSAPEIGVLLGSHCDIDDVGTELEPYVKSAFLKNDGIPLPDAVRPILSGPAWALSRGTVEAQYAAIGPTRYRANAAKQVAAVNTALKAQGIKGKAYLGCDFTFPSIGDALDNMRRDGVKKIVLFNKGAQYSIATGGEHMEDAIAYMKEHPTFAPQKFVMVKEFSSDPRFRKLLGDVIQRDVNTAFPGAPKKDVCILVASHGLPLRMVQNGDPATNQMLDVVRELKQRFSGYDLRHGFLNDDFFPGAEWTTPKAIDVAVDLRRESCPNVFMDSRLSFTTHHRATLFDLDVEAREELESPDVQPSGELHPLYQPAKVVFGQNFDAEPGLAALFASLTKEALDGRIQDLVEVTRTAKVPTK